MVDWNRRGVPRAGYDGVAAAQVGLGRGRAGRGRAGRGLHWSLGWAGAERKGSNSYGPSFPTLFLLEPLRSPPFFLKSRPLGA